MSEKKRNTILYIDDEEINLFLFQRRFESEYSILTANSGTEGLEKLEAHAGEISIVISDLLMPEMTGIEFVEEAKKKHKDVAYFIASGYKYNEEIERAIKNNLVLGLFNKPIDFEEMSKAVNDINNNQNKVDTLQAGNKEQ